MFLGIACCAYALNVKGSTPIKAHTARHADLLNMVPWSRKKFCSHPSFY